MLVLFFVLAARRSCCNVFEPRETEKINKIYLQMTSSEPPPSYRSWGVVSRSEIRRLFSAANRSANVISTVDPWLGA